MDRPKGNNNNNNYKCEKGCVGVEKKYYSDCGDKIKNFC